MNAFAHRLWTSAGGVQIDIFNDAVEILSPGWFIEGQDPDEHLAGSSTSSKTRNALITKTLYRSGDIESYGTGIPRMKELCSEVGVEIEYVKTPDGAKLVFHRNDAFADESAAIRRNPPQSDVVAQKLEALGKNDRLVYEYLQRSGSVPSAEVLIELSMPVRTVRDALRRLTENELVIPSGNGKNRTYRIAEA